MDDNQQQPALAGFDTGPEQGYRVLARKYRPSSFDDLVGQEPMVQTLSNAFKTGRIAQAYMLTGVRGIGKTTTARILARALNYKTSDIDEPSIELGVPGEHCHSIMSGNHLDVIEMDAASHTGIDDIRDLIDSAQYKPATARFKVYIIDEVHMLSRNAFNGLLKTLEEPPAHLKFIFATTEINKVPVTVLSRCQRFDLRRINAQKMSQFLTGIAAQEGVELEDAALSMITRASEGSARDALSLLDQAIAHTEGKISAEEVRSMLGLADRSRIMDLFEHLMSADLPAALLSLREQYDAGAEPVMILSELADFVHFVTRLKYVPEMAKSADVSDLEGERGLAFAQALSVRILGRAWQILLKGIEEVSSSERQLAASDMVLVRLAHASTLPTPDEIIKTIESDSPAKDQRSGSPSPMPSGAPPSAVNPSVPAAGEGLSASSQASVVSTPPSAAPTASANINMSSVPKFEAEPAPERVESSSPNEHKRELHRFEELIFLAEDKRDLQIKTWLRKSVRLVHFENGKMEINLVANPPATFLQDLHARLLAWTGRRWVIATSREGGAPTLEEMERSQQKTRMDDARSDPSIAAILAKFPGAKVVDVRIREDEAASDSHDVERGDGLDDFFE